MIKFILILFLVFLILIIRDQKNQLKTLKHTKQSQSVNYGKITENFLPFTKLYPYESKDFRFLGSPIDGVQFTKDKIIFVEFKFNKSRLSDKQKEIKKLIEAKKITFEVFYLS